MILGLLSDADSARTHAPMHAASSHNDSAGCGGSITKRQLPQLVLGLRREMESSEYAIFNVQGLESNGEGPKIKAIALVVKLSFSSHWPAYRHCNVTIHFPSRMGKQEQSFSDADDQESLWAFRAFRASTWSEMLGRIGLLLYR